MSSRVSATVLGDGRVRVVWQKKMPGAGRVEVARATGNVEDVERIVQAMHPHHMQPVDLKGLKDVRGMSNGNHS